MPTPEETPAVPPEVADLVRQVVASADRAGQLRSLLRLSQVGAAVAGPIVRHLAGSGADGPRLALEFVARLPRKLPPEVVRAALPVLAERSIPPAVRLAAAAALLGSVPDSPRAVGAVVRATTAGLSRSRALERMYQLQSRVGKCDALDALVAMSEGRVQLRCPRCPARLTRRELIPHLWHAHRLVYQQGQARDPRVLLDAAITTAATAGEPDGIDHSYLLAAQYFPDSDPRQVLQALAARGAADPTQTDRLLGRAADEGAGLCPVCLSTVPDPIPELPPPANVSAGRVSADGYSANVADGQAVILIPGADPIREPLADAGRSPRQVAVLVALPLLLLAAVAVAIVPAHVADPVWVGVWLGLVGWMAYLAVRLIRRPLPDRTERAVDLAWVRLAPVVGRTPPAARFLTRLARSSIGAGDPVARGGIVFELVQHAAVLADKGPAYQQLLAAARVLEVLDQGRIGRERVVGLVGVFDPFLRGELGPAYAEAAAQTLLESDALWLGDAERLGVLVVGAAFENGLTPADLVTVGRFCPWFRRVALAAPPDHLALLHAVWRGRNARPWAAVGDAATAFELAREMPAAGRRILGDFPDTLLRVNVGDAAEAELGPVLVTVRGVVAAGHVVADPAAVVELARTSDGWRLRFGPHRLALSSRVPARVADELRKWLKYRAATLFPEAERPSPRGPGSRAVGILVPLAVACPLCGARSVLRAGQVGTPWQGLANRPG
ncbi:MAG TPA: hypothetical protein VFG68_12805 [Fimbriiglobus sp.]|nr:hypothetical protein [Fimbriiglobus sp.]